MSYTIETIAERISARRVGDTPATIDWLLTDSRSLSFPEETLFFALTTKRNDGARYIPDLYSRGVRNFVVSKEAYKWVESGQLAMSNSDMLAVNFLVVANPLKALQKLAEQHREQFQIPVIGITGSNGKTIVKEWLHQLFRLADERAVRTRYFRSWNFGDGRDACLAEYHQTYHWHTDQHRRSSSGELLLFAREVHGKTVALQELRCGDL